MMEKNRRVTIFTFGRDFGTVFFRDFLDTLEWIFWYAKLDNFQRVHQEFDILQHWKGQQETPNLQQFALELLRIPISTSAVERGFSKLTKVIAKVS